MKLKLKKIKKCDHEYEVMRISNITTVDKNQGPMILCSCKCKKCGDTVDQWRVYSGSSQDYAKNIFNGEFISVKWNSTVAAKKSDEKSTQSQCRFKFLDANSGILGDTKYIWTE